jgi:hypothetical protein
MTATTTAAAFRELKRVFGDTASSGLPTTLKLPPEKWTELQAILDRANALQGEVRTAQHALIPYVEAAKHKYIRNNMVSAAEAIRQSVPSKVLQRWIICQHDFRDVVARLGSFRVSGRLWTCAHLFVIAILRLG